MDLKEIQRPVADHLERFEPYFQKNLHSPNALLSLATNYVFRRKGKRMRPLLVFLSAMAAGGVKDATYAAAALIELLHNASLVHDDVVDETYTRRSQWSLMGLWGSKVAVLVGDFFLSRGMSLALEGGHYDILAIVSKAVRDLSEGELSQMEHARRLDITEDAYYEIIRQKTATLIEACTRAGATSAGGDATLVNALASYGNNLGLAFQIRDDMFDYSPGGSFGKPALNDVKEQKITLPLLAAMRNAPKAERDDLVRHIRRHPKADETANAALRLVSSYGGMDYANQQMAHFANLAIKDLEQLPASDARTSLEQLVQYNTSRKI